MPDTSNTPDTAEPMSGPAEETQNATPEQLPTLLASVEEWLHTLRAMLARAVNITVLEARLAALNFVLILIIAVASGLLLATAWITFFAAVVAWLHELGLSWSMALLLMAAINLLLAIAGGVTIYRMSNNLLFKAARKFILYGESDDERVQPATGNPPPAP